VTAADRPGHTWSLAAFSAWLRTPRSAAVAGIVFALTLGAAIVLFRLAGPDASGGDNTWLTDPHRRGLVSTGVNLVPFAGIAFLWFIGVLRTRMGSGEDKLFATVFLGSGLLFVAMLFAATSVLAALLLLEAQPGSPAPDTVTFAQEITASILGTFGARMSAVFVLSATTLSRRTAVIPRWLVVTGYAVALVLLASPPLTGWTHLLFPAWVLLVSIHILIRSANRETVV
jgi:hypothetical protein